MYATAPSGPTILTASQIEAEEAAALEARGKAACGKSDRRETLTEAEFADMCRYLDPVGMSAPGRKRFR